MGTRSIRPAAAGSSCRPVARLAASVDLRDLQRNWNEFGRRNPFGAIVTLTHDEGELPEWDRDEFFQTGAREIDAVVEYVKSLPVDPSWRRGLDFGCGVGRLTQAIGRHVDEVVGVDIAPSMVDLAREHNALGDRCSYHVNDHPDLRLFEDDSFDFIYSTIVLQHIAPEYSRGYIREFVRVLAPGGVALFDVPSHRVPPAQPLRSAACRAEIALVDAPPPFAAGVPQTLRVRVRNASPDTWSGARVPDAAGQLRLGNHWLDRRGHPIALDDGRAALPRDVAPGETVECSLEVRPPRRPGAYILELDMVQEGVTWFAERGSTVRRVVAFVIPGLASGRALRARLRRRAESPAAEQDEPSMEMHAVPRAEVVELVESSGGRILAVDPSVAAGASWLGFRYCITK
jgi:SAM-dependent methyltransferase